MPLYTPGRRRAILALLLSSVLLLTVDLRGNALLDDARSLYHEVSKPFESAAEVVARPVRNAWQGITRYDDLENENQQLRAERDALRADTLSARAVLSLYFELLAQNQLSVPGEYERVTAQVEGASPSNFDQIIEIAAGSNDGIATGMPVVSAAGLVGKVTRVFPDSAQVLLITDTDYHLVVKIVRPSEPIETLPPPTTSTTTTTTTTTTVPTSLATGESAPPPTSATTLPPTTTATLPPTTTTTSTPGTEDSTAAASSTTTTTTFSAPERETGQISGMGPGELPQIGLVADAPGGGAPAVGDVVFTAGGSESLAPADIPIGYVAADVERSPAEGPSLVVQPFVNLDELQFVQVVLYRPAREVAGSEN